MCSKKIVNDLIADDEPVMPLEKKDLSGDVVSRLMQVKMTSASVEDDQCQMCGRLAGQTYAPETYIRQEFSNREQERKEANKQMYVHSIAS